MLSDEPWSCVAVTVIVCAVFQLEVVNVSSVGSMVNCASPVTVIDTVVAVVGWEASLTV